MLKKSPAIRVHREDYYLLAYIYKLPGLNNRELSDKVKSDYEGNFSKRAGSRLAKRLIDLELAEYRKGPDRYKRWYPVKGLSLEQAQHSWIKQVEG